MKKKMLVDLDYVICIPGFLKILNDFCNTNYIEDDFTEYIIDDVIGPEEKIQEFYEYYLLQDGYKDAVFIKDAKEVLEKLSAKYDIYICSACVMFGAERKSAKLFKDKFEYLMRELNFIDPGKIIFTNSKNIFEADVQIDDRVPNLQGNVKKKILFTAYHNKNINDLELRKQNILRANSWIEVEKILEN